MLWVGVDLQAVSPLALVVLCFGADQAGLLGVCYVDAATGALTLGQCEEDDGRNMLRTLLTQVYYTLYHL